MNYRIVVTRTEPNPNYDEEVKAYEARVQHRPPMIYGGDSGDYPKVERDTKMLEVVITGTEWEMVKRSMIRFWETGEAVVEPQATAP